MELDQETANARITVGHVLTLSAQKASAEMDKFSGWLLAGFGAAFAIMFGNLQTVLKYVTYPAFRQAFAFFLIALALGIIQKFLAARIAGSSGAAIKGYKHGKELAERGVQLPTHLLLDELLASAPPPARWLMRGKFEKLKDGDFAITGRLLANTTFAQTLLVLVQAGFSVAAAARLALSLYG